MSSIWPSPKAISDENATIQFSFPAVTASSWKCIQLFLLDLSAPRSKRFVKATLSLESLRPARLFRRCAAPAKTMKPSLHRPNRLRSRAVRFLACASAIFFRRGRCLFP